MSGMVEWETIPPCPCAQDCGHAAGMDWLRCELEAARAEIARLKQKLKEYEGA